MVGMILTGITFVSSLNKVKAQTTDQLAGWDKDIIAQANTGASLSYLSDEEKKLILYTNLVRLQPKMFCQTVLANYIKEHSDTSAEAVSIQAELNAGNALPVLTPDKEMCTIAHDFAEKMGLQGKVGHPNFSIRMKPLMSRFNDVGENCNYGDEFALDAFMALLIDSSDPENLGHRKNLLDPNFTSIGVAKQPHKTYRWNFVMEFAGNKSGE